MGTLKKPGMPHAKPRNGYVSRRYPRGVVDVSVRCVQV
jgi:hypothetical protein